MRTDFDTGHPDLLIVDGNRFHELGREKARAECERLVGSLHRTGMAILWPPQADDHEQLMAATRGAFEDLFRMPEEHLKRKYERVDLGRQVGYTPVHTERARRYDRVVDQFTAEVAPEHYPAVGGWDRAPNVNSRWFHRWGPRPHPFETKFDGLNAPNIFPDEIGFFAEAADGFGTLMDGICDLAYEMLEVGTNLPEGELRNRRVKAPHLVAPTHIDLARFGLSHRVPILAHMDLNGLSAHLPATRGGLVGFLRDGTPFFANVPPGFVLLQAGLQLAGLFGGWILPGLHQVIVPPELLPKIVEANRRGERFDRIGRIWFDHIASDAKVGPVGRFRAEPEAHLWRDEYAGDGVNRELVLIGLLPLEALSPGRRAAAGFDAEGNLTIELAA